MAEDNVGPGSRPSWHEREITQSLLRLANARANLAQLEEQVADRADQPEPDPADLARVEQLQVEIERLITKASGRFGGGARAKLEESQLQQRLVLERLGMASYEQFRDRSTDTLDAVDPAVLDFARRECADAEREFLEVAAMVIPDAEQPGQDAEDADGEVIAAADSFADDATLDLRIEPSAAS